MDLWDLTKLLFRRWYAFVPMLLASSAAVVFMSQTVKPDYSAAGHLQLIPPVALGSKAAESRPANPWVNLGIPALGNAANLSVQDAKVLDRMVDAGLTDNYSVTMEYGATYLSIEAIGASPAQASATVRELMRLLDTEIDSQQKRFGINSADRITTLPLDEGDKVTVVDSTRKRVFLVAAGIAILVSIALTVALDVLLRRRRARRDRGSDVADAAAAVPTSPAPTSPAFPVRARVDVPVGADDDRARVTARIEERRAAGNGGGTQFGAGGEPDELVGSVRQAGGRTEPIPPPNTTAVLPVFRTRWSRRKHRAEDH